MLSCVLGRSEPVTVDIIFDTSRENRQNRRYFVEPEDAKVTRGNANIEINETQSRYLYDRILYINLAENSDNSW